MPSATPAVMADPHERPLDVAAYAIVAAHWSVGWAELVLDHVDRRDEPLDPHRVRDLRPRRRLRSVSEGG